MIILLIHMNLKKVIDEFFKNSQSGLNIETLVEKSEELHTNV